MGKNLQLFQSTQVRKPNPDSDAALLSHKWVNTETFVFLTVNLLYTVQVFLAKFRFQNVILCEKKWEDNFYLDTNTSCQSVFTLP